MREFSFSLSSIWVAQFCCVAPANADDRSAWMPSGERQPSAFLLHPHGYWIEKSTAGHEFQFEEEERNKDHIILHDPGRKIRIRLSRKSAEMRIDNGQYSPWKSDGWVPTAQLPEGLELESPDYRVKFIYFVASDRQPAASYEKKITTLLGFVSNLYQFELRRRGVEHAFLSTAARGFFRPGFSVMNFVRLRPQHKSNCSRMPLPFQVASH